MSNERIIEPTTATALAAIVVHPVIIARFDIASDPLLCWTGPGTFAPSGTGDAALDNYIFYGLPPLLSLSDIVEDFGPGGPTTMTIAGHDLNEDLLLQIVNDRREWRGRRVWLWMALLDTNGHSVIGDPVRIKTGIMAAMNVSRTSEVAQVLVTVDRDLGRAVGSTYRWIDHVRYWPLDSFSLWVARMANRSQDYAVGDLFGPNRLYPDDGGPWGKPGGGGWANGGGYWG